MDGEIKELFPAVAHVSSYDKLGISVQILKSINTILFDEKVVSATSQQKYMYDVRKVKDLSGHHVTGVALCGCAARFQSSDSCLKDPSSPKRSVIVLGLPGRLDSSTPNCASSLK